VCVCIIALNLLLYSKNQIICLTICTIVRNLFYIHIH